MAGKPFSARAFVRGARAATTFLTRLPVGGFPFDDDEWAWCSAWFPAVGALVGLGTALAFVLLARAGAWPAACGAVTAGLLITGAFHEDGLADTADALGGASSRERLFEILKDSRIGSFGGAALVMALVTRVSLLATLGERAPVALIVVGALSRTFPVWLMASMPYVTPEIEARSKPVARAGRAHVVFASVFGTAPLLTASALDLVAPGALVALPLLGASLTLLCGARFRRRAGGITGDFLGATQQVVDIGLLFTLALL